MSQPIAHLKRDTGSELSELLTNEALQAMDSIEFVIFVALFNSN